MSEVNKSEDIRCLGCGYLHYIDTDVEYAYCENYVDRLHDEIYNMSERIQNLKLEGLDLQYEIERLNEQISFLSTALQGKE